MITAAERRAIPRVEAGGEHGTGVLIAPDRVLTAAHVVCERGLDGAPEPLGEIVVRFPLGVGQIEARAATLHPEHWHLAQDWVVLCLEAPIEGVDPFPLAPLTMAAGWRTFGYPQAAAEFGSMQGLTLSDGQVEQLAAEWDGVVAMELYSPKANGLRVPGLSGAPVLVGGAVAGVIRTTFLDEEGRAQAGAFFAAPASAILREMKAAPPAPAEVLPPLLVPTELQGRLPGLGQAIQLDRERQWYQLIKECAQADSGFVLFHGRANQALYRFVERVHRDLHREVGGTIRVYQVAYLAHGRARPATAMGWIQRVVAALGQGGATPAEALKHACTHARPVIVVEAPLPTDRRGRAMLEALVKTEIPRLLIEGRGKFPAHVVLSMQYATPDPAYVELLKRLPPEQVRFVPLPQTRFPPWDEVEPFLQGERVGRELMACVQDVHAALKARPEDAWDFEALLTAVQHALMGQAPDVEGLTMLDRLDAAQIEAVVEQALVCDLEERRALVLKPLPKRVRASLPAAGNGIDQLRSDLMFLNDLPPIEAGKPLVIWLQSAERLADNRPAAGAFFARTRALLGG